MVRMACLDDDAQGQPLEVVWELELDPEILDAEAWQSIGKRGFDAPRHFGAFIHTQLGRYDQTQLLLSIDLEKRQLQFARRLEVISPGGLPAGVTTDNILDQQQPRNRRLAEAFGKCGLVERAGQGMNLMFERAIMQSKPLPDFTATAAHEVRLTLHGTVQNPVFVRFLEKVGQERLASFSTHDFLILDLIQRDLPVPDALKFRLGHLKKHGIVESVGHGRGTRYLVSRRFHSESGQRGVYTRKRGLDREANKTLLLQHLIENSQSGSPLSELHQVLHDLSESYLQRLLHELRDEGKVVLRGQRRWAKWFPNVDLAKAQATGLKRKSGH
jgi:ATP-dependent DNA helicase RecG